MKARNIWIWAALATAGLTACGNDDEPADKNDFPQDGVVRFSVGVNDTRAAHADASTITDFGICIYNAAAPDDYTYNNIRVAKNDAGVWAPEQQMLWQNASQPVDIVAYTPYRTAAYTTSTTDMPVTVAAVQSADTYEDDLLIFRRGNFVPAEDLTAGKLAIDFTHALSRLTVQVAFGTEHNATGPLAVNLIDAGSFRVHGAILSGTCDFTKTTGFVTVSTTDDAAAVTPGLDFTPAAGANDQAVARYDCILIPQTIAADALGFSFTIDGKPYEWLLEKEVTLAANTRYRLAVTIGIDAIYVDGITALPWDDVPADDGSLRTE